MRNLPPHQLALGVLLVFASTPAAHATFDTGSGSDGRDCRYSVAYTAPVGCPSAAAVERRLGPNYRVERGRMSDCQNCVRGIAIEPDVASGYRMRLTGLETTDVARASCDELLELGVYAVEASDLPPPVCEAPQYRLGLATTPLVNVSRGEPMLLTSVRATLVLGDFQVNPSGLWLVPTQVGNQQANTIAKYIDISGYGAGLELCHSLTRSVHWCAAGMWRHLTGSLNAPGWSPQEVNVWSAGGDVTWDVPVVDALHLEIAPTVMAVLHEEPFKERGSQVTLYSHAGIEAQLRVGFSWDLGGSNTPIQSAVAQAGALPTSPPSPTTSARTRWF